jgi:transposase
MDIWLLDRQGHSVHSISRITGLNRRTVKKYLEAGEIPRYRTQNRGSGLAPYYLMIRDWLKEQDYQATRIHELVSMQGYQGSYETVKRFVRPLRQELRVAERAALRFEPRRGCRARSTGARR